MKIRLQIALGFLVAATTLSAALAQTYKWKDEKGQTVIGDTPPPHSSKAKKSGGDSSAAANQASASTEKPAAAETAAKNAPPKNAAEKEMEFKKRQLEAKEKADKEAKEQEDAAKRKENCAQAQQAVRTLESSPRIATVNEKGEREYFDEQKRQAEIERARAAAAEWCK
ncbi:MAG: hypothetical protein BWY57_00869 [Betaproteobacteria bacterium ADurb.Bin341]|nr:MAG: hypothetical protein BWY57_00869 [Betaproteobacteria bacterium ADurb.Bin341]